MRSERLRVLLVAESLSPRGGWGTYSSGVVRGLSGLGVRCRVLIDRRAEPIAPSGAEAIPCLSSALGALDRPRSIAWNAGQILRYARSADVIHFTVEPYATSSLPVALPPTILSVHGTYAVSPLRGDWHTRTLYAGALRRAHSVICSSRFTRGALLRELQLDNLLVIPLGHDIAPESDGSTIEDPPPDGQPLILGVGALKERKRYHVALRAVARLRDRFPNLRYYIVGDDSDQKYVARLRAEIAEHDLVGHVVITGSVADTELRALYRRSDLFLLTPINVDDGFEGFGIAYLEANAFGKPVVGSLDCGAEDAIEDGVNGLLAPQHDVEAIAERAGAILADHQFAARLGAAGRARAARQTLAAVARQYLEIYERALRGKSNVA